MAAREAAFEASQEAAAAENAYYTKKVGTSGKTQAQLDAAKNAAEVAASTGGTINPVTGYVVPPKKIVTGGSSGSGSGSGGSGSAGGSGNNKKVVSTYTDPSTGDVISSYDDGSEVVIRKGTILADKAANDAALKAANLEDRKSAWDLLFVEFTKYGLGSLVSEVRGLVTADVPKAEFILRLRESKTYLARFGGNAERIKNGYKAINEAEYLALEDQYQNIMREYGLPASYYAKDSIGTQAGFTNLIANDVSSTELEDRVMSAQSRVMNSNPEVAAALKEFYPGITNGDILAYTLDPKNALSDIKRKITAAEIGGSAMQAGLKIDGTRADELGLSGVDKRQAQQGFQTVAEVAPRGGELSRVFGQDAYTQANAETEVFGLTGSVDASKKRKKLVGLEQAEFSKSAGVSQGSLTRNRAGQI